MNIDIERLLKRNKDVVDFIAKTIEEEGELSTREMKDAIYKEFGYKRFAKKTFIVMLLMSAGKKEYEDGQSEKESD